MNFILFMFLLDSYKLDHRRHYPNLTERIYSNLTARGTRIEAINETVWIGLRYFLQHYFNEIAQETFFNRPRGEVCDEYQNMLDEYLGPNNIGTQHISDLHDLGYIPLEFWAFPEGTPVPLRIPFFTVENTHDDFFWMTNYIETLISSVLWLPITSATLARRMRQMLNHYAEITGTDPAFVDWQGHDFSFRGMENPDAAALSGAGHLLSFKGSDTIPSWWLIKKYYDGEGLVAASVPATEHSVMCAGGQEDERLTYKRVLDLYPSGIVSIVSDTWDYWNVLQDIIPSLKDQIMSRDGKAVVRPDSGDPVKIICGDPAAPSGSAENKGTVQLLWDTFGGTVTATGHRLLDSHIGVIYGDAITYDRADAINYNLMRNGFASGNMVYGVGSFTYQYNTRDTFAMAMKATSARVDGVDRELFKDPVTDDGTKKSARGRIFVNQNADGTLDMIDRLDSDDWERLNNDPNNNNAMKLIWRNGSFGHIDKWTDMVQRLQSYN